MRRDMDLVRELVLWLEAKNDRELRKPYQITINGYNSDEINYHLVRMYEAELIADEALRSKSTPERLIEVWPFDLTWQGHEFADSVRDADIWAQTKAGVNYAGGFSVELLKALAKGLLKKKIQHHTGIEIEV